jgi:hypothetical protein
LYTFPAHFDTVANNNQVSFNGINAPVHDIFGDSILVVQVPAGVSTGKITVTSHDQKTTSQNDFVILPGSWRRKKDFPDPSGRFVAICFSIGNKGWDLFQMYIRIYSSIVRQQISGPEKRIGLPRFPMLISFTGFH